MVNAEKKKIILDAVKSVLDNVYPDNEQVSKEEAKAVLGVEDAFDIIKAALVATPAPAPTEATVVEETVVVEDDEE